VLRLLVLGSFFVVSSAFAQAEFYVHGGGLRGNGDTTWAAGLAFISKRSDHFGIGFGHYNEGHLPDNHRDGFMAQAWYLQPLGEKFELQLGTGPYASMNNTTVNGVRKNEFRLGLLTSAALKWYPVSSPWHLRLQYNYAFMTSTHDSHAVLLGVGRDFDDRESEANGTRRSSLGLWGGYSRTTQVGPQESAIAYELEAKFPIRRFEHLAYSVSFLREGDTKLADRKGVPIRVWYDQPATDRLTFSFGVGPYPAYNSVGDDRFKINAVVSVRITYLLIKRYEAGLMYTRVASFSDRDQDILMLGFLARL
jgi:hypothetical protein